MKKISILLGTLCASIILQTPDISSAATVTPSVIVANSQSYDGQSILASGTVKGFNTRKSRRGAVSLFQLCDRQCVNVVDLSGAAKTDGQEATIDGTFHVTLRGRKRTMSDVIVVGR